MKELKDAFNAKEEFTHGKAATEEKILQAEDALALNFAKDYRFYLGTYGVASYDGHQLSGIGPVKYRDVVSITLDERNYNSNVKPDMYVLENLGIDNVIAWQDATGTVFVYQYDKIVKKYKSLKDYVLNS